MLTRRHFIITSTALAATPGFAQAKGPVSPPSKWAAWDAQVTPAGYVAETTNPWGIHPRLLPQMVKANAGLTVGDIHVDAKARYLYHIREGGMAMRYGVAIGRGDLYEPGTFTIKVKKKWPTWKPTEEMVERDPGTYKKHEDGMNGGPSNPLGSRALYLFDGNRDTFLRIHGTPSSRSIGSRASSGCVRMIMPHIIDLYDHVAKGSTVHLHPV